MPVAATLELTVTAKHAVADKVVAVTLAHRDRRRLADWAPGAHIDLMLPNGLTRQYSLCGNRGDAYEYRIGVLLDPDGRGGSSFVHDVLRVGDTVAVGGPRNNFTVVPSARYLFIAGGIGITPLLPMIAQADMLGSDWRLVYFGRSRSGMAFTEELTVYGDRVVLWPSDERGRGDVRTWLDTVSTDTVAYCCGPTGMIDVVRAKCANWPDGRLRIERFEAPAQPSAVRDSAFQVHLHRSNRWLTVHPGQSVLDAVAQAGSPVLSSCGQGVCGTCETTVLAGDPDHRDSILSDAERAAGNCMFVCVSRSISDRLVLDL